MSEHTRRISRRVFLGGAAAFGAVSLVNPAIAFATPTSAEKQAEADAVRVQVATLQDDLNKASEDYNTALNEHEAAVAAMEETQLRIDEKSEEITGLQDKLGTRARSMYRSGSTSFLDILLGSKTFEEFATNWDILNQMNQNDADMVEESKTLRTALEEEKNEYAKQEQIAAEKTEEARVIKENAESTVSEMTAILNSLDEEARQLLEEEQRAAAEAAAAAERAAMEAATAAAEREAAEREAAANNNGSSNGGNSGGDNGGSTDNGGGGEDTSSGNGGGYTSNTDIPAQGSVVDYAISRLGCPYVWGATGPNSFDCSGLTSWCYAQIGMNITRTTYTQYSAARAILPLGDAQPGDVLWNSGHVGICTQAGGGQYIHAPSPGQNVSYSNWSQFSCALRF